AQIDRRNGSRVNAQEENLKILFQSKTERGQGQHFTKPCFDISAGGLSFYVSKMEKKFFREGEVLEMLDIVTPDWSSQVRAELILVKELEPNEFNNLPYRVWRVCCRFKGLDEKNRQLLDRYIFERIKNELHAINA